MASSQRVSIKAWYMLPIGMVEMMWVSGFQVVFILPIVHAVFPSDEADSYFEISADKIHHYPWMSLGSDESVYSQECNGSC